MPANDIERWKPVIGFEDSHEVSSHGRVRSLTRYDDIGRLWTGRMRKQQEHPRTKHKMVTITGHGARRVAKVHQLVLESFVGPKPEGGMCCHYDGDPGNNRLENLKWGTAYENWDDMKRHGTTPWQTRPRATRLAA